MIRAFLLAATLAAGTILGGSGGATAADFDLRVGSYAPEGDVIDRALQRVKQEIETRSDGRIELTIFRSNSLGTNREVLEMVKIGSADFVVAGAPHVSNFAPALGSLSFPFLWKDSETMLEILDGDLGQKLIGITEQQAEGLKVMAWWDTGFRHVTNNVRPILKAEDIKGLKLRTLPTPVQVNFWRALGAIPTPMGWAEVMPSLQQGVIDGQENPPAVVYPYKVYEFQKYYSLTGHSTDPTMLVMSKATYESLPPDLQQAVTDGINVATPFEREIATKYNAEIMDELGKVIKINTLPEEELAKFRAVAASVYEESYAEIGEEGRAMVEEVIRRTH